VKPQVSQHFGECAQVTESGVTEPGLQADLRVRALHGSCAKRIRSVQSWSFSQQNNTPRSCG
jgi:hypothetical protein